MLGAGDAEADVWAVFDRVGARRVAWHDAHLIRRIVRLPELHPATLARGTGVLPAILQQRGLGIRPGSTDERRRIVNITR